MDSLLMNDNRTLEDLVRGLKGRLTHFEQEEKMGLANQILYTAIFEYPHLANGISIDLLVDFVKNPHIGSTQSPRFRLKEYIEGHIGAAIDAPVNLQFVVPLPHSPNTKGWEEMKKVYRSPGEPTFPWNSPLFGDTLGFSDNGLILNLGRPFMSDEVVFHFDEVLKVQLVHAKYSEFSPLFTKRFRGEEFRHINPQNPVIHYLEFREFYPSLISSSKQNNEIGEHAKYVWLPHPETNLFKRQPGSVLRKSTFYGFAADLSSGHPILYEFSAPNPYTESFDGNPLNEHQNVARVILNEKEEQFTIKRYVGDEIVNRLAQFPPLINSEGYSLSKVAAQRRAR